MEAAVIMRTTNKIAQILLTLLLSACLTPCVFAGENVDISVSGREIRPLDDQGNYVEIVYGSEGDPGEVYGGAPGGTTGFIERDTSASNASYASDLSEAIETVTDIFDEGMPEEDVPWWKSRNAKIAYAFIGAAVLVTALGCAIRAVKRRRAQKVFAAAAETAPATAFIPPSPIQSQTAVQPPRPEPSRLSPPPAKAEIKLTTVSPAKAKQYTAKIADKIEIGRGEQCQVRIGDDTSVSSRHCEISWSAGALYLRDLDSSNGTSVNGVPIHGPYKLKPRDVIELGRLRLRLGEIKTL
jgi:hypothetical protein